VCALMARMKLVLIAVAVAVDSLIDVTFCGSECSTWKSGGSLFASHYGPSILIVLCLDTFSIRNIGVTVMLDEYVIKTATVIF
jgi:hypothetical protein